MATKDKPNNKNLRALFSVICLCIVAMGLIVYFSTQSKTTTGVNEATTLAETTEVQKRVKVKETVTQTSTAAPTTQKQTTTKKETTTQKPTMASSDTNVPYKSFYKYPCDETVLNGYTTELVKNETMGDYRAHPAVDFKCANNDEVSAINDGLVLSVTKDSLLGKVVEIDHGGKLVAKYCGLDSVNVKEGDYVTIGQTLGKMGKVPFELGAESHLHFETLLDGEYVNPLDVMSKTE